MTDPREPGPLDFDAAPPAPAPPAAPPPAAPRRRAPAAQPGGGGGRYLWVVGAGALVLVIVLVVATLQHGTQRGARGVPDGQLLPPFAVPLALSSVDGDANIATHAGEGQAGHRAACSVVEPGVLNGCTLRAGGPLVLAFFETHGRQCVQQLDVMQHVSEQTTGVRFAAIAIRGKRGDIRTLIRQHGWRFPIGWDRDGALSNAYHVQVCPQLTFARDGRAVATTFGEVGVAALAARVRRLAAG